MAFYILLNSLANLFFYNFSNPVQSVCTYSHRIVLAMKKEKGECVQGRGVNTTLFKVLISFSQMSDAVKASQAFLCLFPPKTFLGAVLSLSRVPDGNLLLRSSNLPHPLSVCCTQGIPSFLMTLEWICILKCLRYLKL